jgi:hypothetical protein
MTCKHCQKTISSDDWPVHTEGNYSGKHRCDPADSGLPYGFEAAPVGVPCSYPCLGAEG